MQARQADLADMQLKIIDWLQKKMPHARKLSISGMERSGSGMSNESFLFNLSWQEASQNKSAGMVLRCAPRSYPVFPEYDLSKQFHIMKALKGTDVPVPTVYWLEENTTLLGVPFYLMGKIDGVIPPDIPPYHSFGLYYDATPEQRAKMWWGCLEKIARIHKLDWKALGLSFLGVPGGGTDPLDRELKYWEGYLDWVMEKPGEPQPILRAALKWLQENRYMPDRVSLCWGDCRMGNTIYRRSDLDVLGILDWEMAYLGDPESELGWFMLRDWVNSEAFGIPRLEGSPGKEETIRRYEQLTGWKVKHMLYQDILAVLRHGALLVRHMKNFRKLGTMPPEAETNNYCTQRLAELLNLPAPGAQLRQTTNIEDMAVTMQIHLTGPGGSDWYLVSDKGQVSRHEGTIDNPTIKVTISAKDWAAIQRGDMKRIHAWTSGKFKVEGDMNLFSRLEEFMNKLER